MSQLKLRKFVPKSIVSSSVAIFGPTNKLINDLIKNSCIKFSRIICFTSEENFSEREAEVIKLWSNSGVESTDIYISIDDKLLNDLYNNRLLEKEKLDELDNIFMIVDVIDISKGLEKFIENHRNLNITLFLLFQNTVKSDFDYVFVPSKFLSRLEEFEQKEFYKQYFGILKCFEDFKKVMDSMYTSFLIGNNLTKSEFIEDKIYWYGL